MMALGGTATATPDPSKRIMTEGRLPSGRCGLLAREGIVIDDAGDQLIARRRDAVTVAQRPEGSFGAREHPARAQREQSRRRDVLSPDVLNPLDKCDKLTTLES